MERRRYARTEKAKAVALAMTTSTEQAAQTLGIPRRTIGNWISDPEFEELRNRTRDQVAEVMWTTVQIALHEVAKGLRDPDASLRDKVVALGVVYDKHALLTGAATSRSESRDLTGSLSDADLIAALRAADAVAGTRGDPPAPPGEAAG